MFTESHNGRQVQQLVCQECGYNGIADRLVKMMNLISD